MLMQCLSNAACAQCARMMNPDCAMRMPQAYSGMGIQEKDALAVSFFVLIFIFQALRLCGVLILHLPILAGKRDKTNVQQMQTYA